MQGDQPNSIAAQLAAQFGPLTDVDVLQPVDAFLETAGEGLRSRLFITEGEAALGGKALCLRPEYTIPLCLKHLQSGATEPAHYIYCGDVFRRGRPEGVQYAQAGAEFIGGDAQEDDAAALAAALWVLPPELYESTQLVLGDQGLFEALMVSLDVPLAIRPRLAKAFGHRKQLMALLERASQGKLVGDAGQAGSTDAELEADIVSKMEAAGLPLSGGREPRHIARRFSEKQAALQNPVSQRAVSVMTSYLALEAPYGSIEKTLKDFAAEHSVEFGDALGHFDTLLRSLDMPISTRFHAGFGRPMEYYSGLIFELRQQDSAESGSMIFGGRYDRLFTLLGSQKAVPAVGFAAALDRIDAALAQVGVAP
jgi:ATP phosphoribosyltransferase regulatory subunit